MKFKQEELVEREREIAGYLLKDFSLKMVSQKTGFKPQTSCSTYQQYED